jgi:hypothetical protein
MVAVRVHDLHASAHIVGNQLAGRTSQPDGQLDDALDAVDRDGDPGSALAGWAAVVIAPMEPRPAGVKNQRRGSWSSSSNCQPKSPA